MEYLVLKYLHVISSTLLFGTGIGSAFYLLATTLTRDARVVAVVARMVVCADWLFTASTAVLQPLTGAWLVQRIGLPPWTTPWLKVSIICYALAIACWLPVVFIQMRLRDEAEASARDGRALSQRYWRLFFAWAALGVPALLLFLAIFWLMVAKPALQGLPF
jgi:uncharacterized membrane protein